MTNNQCHGITYQYNVMLLHVQLSIKHHNPSYSFVNGTVEENKVLCT